MTPLCVVKPGLLTQKGGGSVPPICVIFCRLGHLGVPPFGRIAARIEELGGGKKERALLPNRMHFVRATALFLKKLVSVSPKRSVRRVGSHHFHTFFVVRVLMSSQSLRVGR